MIKQIEKDFNNKLTKKDYFLYLINRNMFILVSPLVILSLIVVFIFMVNKDGFQSIDLLYLLPISLFLLSYTQMFREINRALKSNSQTKKIKVILDDNKYREITDNGENSLKYDKFYAYYENKNYYYLYIDRINALILPKREFDSNELTHMNNTFERSMRKVNIFNIKSILGLIFSVALIISMVILIISMF